MAHKLIYFLIVILLVTLAACSPGFSSHTTQEVVISTPSLTPTKKSTNTPTITLTALPTPDKGQQPPGYTLDVPDLLYKFFDIPSDLSGKQAIVVRDSTARESMLEYLTLDGEYGKLMEVEIPASLQTSLNLARIELADDHTIIIQLGRRDVPSPPPMRYYHIYDFKEGEAWEFGYNPTYEFNSYEVREQWGFTDDYFILRYALDCEYEIANCIQEKSYKLNYAFIPRDNPQYVIRANRDNPNQYFQLGEWLLGLWRDSYGLEYCSYDPQASLSCKSFKDDDADSGNDWDVQPSSLSPDGKWLVVRSDRRWEGQYNKTGLIPTSCFKNSSEKCIPQWLPIHNISRSWSWDCKAIHDQGLFWAPNSEYLYFFVEEPHGQAGPDPDAGCKGTWQGNELWRYDMQTGELKLLKEYDVEAEMYPLATTKNETVQPVPVWTSDGKNFVVFRELDDDMQEVYLISAVDGELTLLGKVNGKFLGVIKLP